MGCRLATTGLDIALGGAAPSTVQLDLVVPARVDVSSGYRLYSEDQVERARLVGLLRWLGMPLAIIALVLDMDGAAAVSAISKYWDQVEATLADRRRLVSYLEARLTGESHKIYDIDVRHMPDRKLLTISRHVNAAGAHAFFQVFYGEVSEDSDGPMELCVPVVRETDEEVVKDLADIQLRFA
jgi:DNA-binding transcriptional MerR regulator